MPWEYRSTATQVQPDAGAAATARRVLSIQSMRAQPEPTPIASPDPHVTAETLWEPPRFELICLACEISAYAPDGDLPLF